MIYLKKWVLLVLFSCGFSLAVENTLFLTGVPRYDITPTQELIPSFGFWFESMGDVPKMDFGAGGEFGREKLRVGFLEEYRLLDSIYRQSYSEVNLGYSFPQFSLGAGYGFSMEWIPAGELWIRHRYKLGVSLTWRQLYLGGMLSGWFDDVRNSEFLLGGALNVGEQFKFYGEWDGSFFAVGANVIIKSVELTSAYRFPGFGAAFSISFSVDSWLFGGSYGFSNESFDRFKIGVFKKLKKKTIL